MQFRLKSGSSAGEILPSFKMPRDLPLALSATRQTPLLGGKLIASRLGKLKTWKTQELVLIRIFFSTDHHELPWHEASQKVE